MQHHVCLETHGVVVDYKGGDKATVYASTQWTFSINGEAANALGLKAPNVESVVEYMGGGFGSKFGLMLPGGVACQLSKQAKAPVKLMFNRPEEFLMGGNRNGAFQKVKAGASKDGKIIALRTEQFELGGLGQGGLAGTALYLSLCRMCTGISRTSIRIRTHRFPCVGRGILRCRSRWSRWLMTLPPKSTWTRLSSEKRTRSDKAFHRQLDMGAKELGWEKRPKTPGSGAFIRPV